MATLAGRMLVVLVPLGVLIYPLFKTLPQVYDWIMRSKIVRLYDEMRSIEREMEAGAPGQDAVGMLAKLDQLDQRANHLRVPTAYASMLYMLRAHIDLVRERLAAVHDRKADEVPDQFSRSFGTAGTAAIRRRELNHVFPRPAGRPHAGDCLPVEHDDKRDRSCDVMAKLAKRSTAHSAAEACRGARMLAAIPAEPPTACLTKSAIGPLRK